MEHVERTLEPVLLSNPLNPHDALKHHFASFKNDLLWTKKFLEQQPKA